MTIENLEYLCAIAKKAAIEAGQFVQSRQNQNFQKLTKSSGSTQASQIVTEVDIKSQEIILNHLEPSITRYNLGLLTEEKLDDQSRLQKSHFWCIDPLDGTLPFTEDKPGYAVSVALVSQSGDPVVSAVYIPNENNCYTAIKGRGVSLNDSPYARKSLKKGLNVYMDRSYKSDPKYTEIFSDLRKVAEHRNMKFEIYAQHGAVCNAISVMTSEAASYFKLPKPSAGGGSIWDFAATRLFFEELKLPVSNAIGDKLRLNDEKSTFMNHQGVVFASDNQLAGLLLSL